MLLVASAVENQLSTANARIEFCNKLSKSCDGQIDNGTVKSSIFWVVTWRKVVSYRRFGTIWRYESILCCVTTQKTEEYFNRDGSLRSRDGAAIS
jgi:hypothetical protein